MIMINEGTPQHSGDGVQMLECNGTVKPLPKGSKWTLKIANRSGIPFVVNDQDQKHWCMSFFQTVATTGKKSSNVVAAPDLNLDNAKEKSLTSGPGPTLMPGQASQGPAAAGCLA